MSNVTVIRVSDAERLALVLRQCGYVDPDDLIDLDDCVWDMAATCAGLTESPNTAVRCACVCLFGLPVATETRGERDRAALRSLASLSEPAVLASSRVDSSSSGPQVPFRYGKAGHDE